MKRLLTLIFSFCLIFSPAITTEAKSPDNVTSTYIEYINDDLFAEVTLSVTTKENYIIPIKNSVYFNTFTKTSICQKTTSKTYNIKNSSGTTLAKYTLTGTFIYDGSSSACTKATYSSSITDPLYSFISRTARCSGNSAIGNFTLVSSIHTISKTLTLKCSPSGVIQ